MQLRFLKALLFLSGFPLDTDMLGDILNSLPLPLTKKRDNVRSTNVVCFQRKRPGHRGLMCTVIYELCYIHWAQLLSGGRHAPTDCHRLSVSMCVCVLYVYVQRHDKREVCLL